MTNFLLKSLDVSCLHFDFHIWSFLGPLAWSVLWSRFFLTLYADLFDFCKSLFSLLSQQQTKSVERKVNFHMLAEWTESDKCKSHGCTAQEWGSGTSEFSVITSMDVQLLGPGLGPPLGAGGSILTNTVCVSVKSSWVLFPYRAKNDCTSWHQGWHHNTLQQAAHHTCPVNLRQGSSSAEKH